jgi:hypothetical protein
VLYICLASAGLPSNWLRQNHHLQESTQLKINRDLLCQRPDLLQLQLAEGVNITAVRRDDMMPLLAAARACMDVDAAAAVEEALPLARQAWIGDVIINGRCYYTSPTHIGTAAAAVPDSKVTTIFANSMTVQPTPC